MLELTQIRVATGSEDREGRLVLKDGTLVGVIVRLDDPSHGKARGQWNLEAGFDSLNGLDSPLFRDLDDAYAWIEEQLSAPR